MGLSSNRLGLGELSNGLPGGVWPGVGFLELIGLNEVRLSYNHNDYGFSTSHMPGTS